ETNGNTNLDYPIGTIMFWFSPDWKSASLGGTGPGTWGRFMEAGTNGSPYGLVSLYTDPGGTNIYFQTQTNGLSTNYLISRISWASNEWHLIGVTYSRTNSTLFLDGQIATNGPGVLWWPTTNVTTLRIGSDTGTGLAQARGQFDDMVTISELYDEESIS